MPSAQARSRATPERPCLNCGDPTPGRFCPSCGQRKMDVRVSTWRMLREALDDQLSLNSALPRSLAALFLAPGKLTEEYFRGRIVRYIPPFRLYLVASLLFFVTMSTFEGSGIQIGEGPGSGEAGTQFGRAQEGQAPFNVQLSRDAADSAAAAAGAGAAADSGRWVPITVEEDDPALLAWIKGRLLRLNDMDREQALTLLSERFDAYLSTGVFLLVPAFGLLVMLLYVRQRRFFVEHFVFALHVHAAGFLAITAGVLVKHVTGWEGAVQAVLLLLLGYLFVALRRVYGSGVVGTVARMMVLLLLYTLTLSVVLVGVFLVAVMLL